MSKPSSRSDLVRDVGRRVAELRALRGWSQEELGERLGIATKNAQRIEAGRQNLTLRTLDHVARALSCEPIELLRLPGSGLDGSDGVPAEWRASLESCGLEVVGAGSGPSPAGTVPAYTIEGAAAMLTGQKASPVAWVAAPSKKRGRRPTAGLFVIRAPDASMEPIIRDGSWGLFRHPVEGELEGRVLFVVQPGAGSHGAPVGLIRKAGPFLVDRQGRLGMRLVATRRTAERGDDLLLVRDSGVRVPAAELVTAYRPRA